MDLQLPALPLEVRGMLLGFAEDKSLVVREGRSPEEGGIVQLNTSYGLVVLPYAELVKTDAAGAARLVQRTLRAILVTRLEQLQTEVEVLKRQLAGMPEV